MANFDFHFCRQKFKFEFLAPKLAYFLHISGLFPSLYILSINSCSNRKMTLMKILQICPHYPQIKRFLDMMTLPLVKLFEQVGIWKCFKKNALPFPPGPKDAVTDQLCMYLKGGGLAP